MNLDALIQAVSNFVFGQRKALLEIYAAFQTENSAQKTLAEDTTEEELS